MRCLRLGTDTAHARCFSVLTQRMRQHISHCTTLRTLDLSRNRLGNDGIGTKRTTVPQQRPGLTQAVPCNSEADARDLPLRPYPAVGARAQRGGARRVRASRQRVGGVRGVDSFGPGRKSAGKRGVSGTSICITRVQEPRAPRFEPDKPWRDRDPVAGWRVGGVCASSESGPEL